MTELLEDISRPKRNNSSAVAYKEIKSKILNNVFPAGAQVIEKDLCEMLGLSRTPVREALVRLEEEGLVQLVPRHGMRVLPVSVDDIREIYDLLESLEPKAAELLAKRGLKGSKLAGLEKSVKDMTEALKNDDLDAWAVADENYHLHLVELCGNRRLASVVMNCWDQSHRVRILTLRLRPPPTRSTQEHIEALQAIKDGNATLAHDLFREHRRRGGEELLGLLDRYKLANF